MPKIETKPVGEIIELKGVKLQVAQGEGNCKGCYFDKDWADCESPNVLGFCSHMFRSDKINVIFKQVKE